jgi:hypothetical protein
VKRSAITALLIFACLMATTTAYGQKGCGLNIIGTWKVVNSNQSKLVFYRFAADGMVTMLSPSGARHSSELREIGTATYKLDDPKEPKVILFETTKDVGGFAKGITSMEIIAYDDTSLTLGKPGSGSTRWTRVDPHRYFIVFAGTTGVFFDQSGPTFPMLIKMDGQQTQIDAVGIYAEGNKWAFGPVPAATYNEFMKEPRKDSDVMLRLEITEAQYERGLKIVRTWARRVREGDLLYPDLFLDNVLLAKQVTESLNQCGDKFKLYKLDWSLSDHISQHNTASRSTFVFFKELRRLNESLHVRDEQFHERGHSRQPAGK